jgi:type II secretory pathway pseudopilin PulG
MARPRLRHPAFSLVEVLVALTLIGLAGATLLLATTATTEAGADAMARSIARGIAEQLIDDAAGVGYHEPGSPPLSYPLGRDAGETANPLQTALFDDTDDFHGYHSSPPRDRFGMPLGQGNHQGGLRPENFRMPDGYFANWQVEVSVAFADEDSPAQDLAPPATSGLKAVRVRVTRQWNGSVQELIMLRQVFAYVPPT